jgi:hypothetical protein
VILALDLYDAKNSASGFTMVLTLKEFCEGVTGLDREIRILANFLPSSTL